MQAVKQGRRSCRVAGSVWILVVLCVAIVDSASAQPLLPLPARSASAPTGSQFYEQFRALPDREREARIMSEISGGNVPAFLRSLKAMSAEETTHGETHRAEYYVTCDYMAIGSDTD